MRKIIFSLMTVFLWGCGHEPTVEIESELLNASSSSPKSVAVAVYDQRSYIMSGEKPPAYIGQYKLRFGDPYDALTESGKAMSSEFTQRMANILSSNNQIYKPVFLSSKIDRNAAISELLSQGGAERYILLTLKEWRSKTFVDTELSYDIQVEVFNGQGEILARRKSSGHDTFGGSFASGPVTNAKAALKSAFESKMRLMSDPQVKLALTTQEVEPLKQVSKEEPVAEESFQSEVAGGAASGGTAGGAQACTVRQILAMKNKGMFDEDILSRCDVVKPGR
jgi:hypothetical protein